MIFGRYTLKSSLVQLQQRLFRRCLAGAEFNARQWSNVELGRFAPFFQGAVVNVSAGKDGDKNGRRYRDYFSGCNEYAVSNFGALSGLDNEFPFDLEMKALPADLQSRYDVVFNHTVLEHVYEVHMAVRNICGMSRDLIVTVVPFLQSFHHDEWYSDYWRFSPVAVQRLFGEHGFATLYTSWNEDPLGNLYVFHICSKCPERWSAIAAQQAVVSSGPGVLRDRLVYGSANDAQARIDVGSGASDSKIGHE